MNEVYPNCFREDPSRDLTVLVEPLRGFRSVALGIYLSVGSREDPWGKEGLAHFTEHMVFKGTTRRSALEIAKVFDSLGGSANGATAEEYTVFHASVLAEGLARAMEVLTEIVTSPRFDPADVRLERAVALEEIREAEDNPEEVVFRLLDEALWGKDHPLGRPVLGWRETVSSLGEEDLWRFFREHYLGGRKVVVACGVVEPGELLELVGGLSAEGIAHGDPVRRAPVPAPALRLTERPVQQVHLALGFPTVPADHGDRMGLEVLNTILGGGMSSRLFQRIREERGLAYAVFSFTRYHTDAGLLGIYTASEEGKVPEVLGIVAEELERLRGEPPSEEELERAKRRIRGLFLLGLESPQGRMARLGWLGALGLPLRSPEEVLWELDGVDAGEVRELAFRYLLPERMAVSMVGPSAERMERMAKSIRAEVS